MQGVILSKRKPTVTALESIEPVEVPAGRFEDCIAIVVTLESETSKFDISARKEHCAGVGMVRHRIQTKLTPLDKESPRIL